METTKNKLEDRTVLSDEERQKIEEEEKLRAKIQKEIQGEGNRKKHSKRKSGCLIVVLIFAIFIIISILGASSSINKTSSVKQPALSFEEVKGMAMSGLSYDELLRNNEKYIGKIVYYKGEVSQISETGENKYILRVYVTKKEYSWDDDIYVVYSGNRILENDIIDLWGRVEGVKKYSTVLGATRSIPEITALFLEAK